MRSLTSSEIAQFQLDYPMVTASSLPPWGGVMEYNGMRVLVYFTWRGTLYLTDITDHPELLSNIEKTWDPNTLSWWYHVPSEFAGRVAEVYTNIANASQQVIGNVGDIIGALPGTLSVVSPTGLITVAIVGVVVLLIMNKAK